MNADLGEVGPGASQDMGDLRKPKAMSGDGQQDPGEADAGEQAKTEEPAKPGIIRLGAAAKYSQGRSGDEEVAAGRALAARRAAEEEHVVEAHLHAYLKAMQAQAAEGHVVKTLRSLEMTLKDKLRVYQDQPGHRALWSIAKLLADVALKTAVKHLNNRQLDLAFKYLKLTQKHTEPLAGSNWSKNEEWIVLRKNLHKNFALYHQKNTMWQQAFDNLKLALRLELALGLQLEVTNTCLTCAIIQ